jgi:hypothetical protein
MRRSLVCGDARQNAVAEDLVEAQLVQVDVPDVAAAALVGARALLQRIPPVVRVQTTDWRADEVATSHRAVAVHGDYGGPRAAGLAQGRMPPVVDREQWIDPFQPLHLGSRVVVRDTLVRVHPQVDIAGKLGSQRGDLGAVLLQANDPDAEPHPASSEVQAAFQKPGAGDLTGVEGGPESQFSFVALLYPVKPRGEVGLDGGSFQVRHAGEPDEGSLVAPADERFAPRGEEDGDAVDVGVLHPPEKALQRVRVRGVVIVRLGALGEGTVLAPIVAAR